MNAVQSWPGVKHAFRPLSRADQVTVEIANANRAMVNNLFTSAPHANPVPKLASLYVRPACGANERN